MTTRARNLLESLLRESEEIDYQLRTLDALKSRLEGFTSNLSPDNPHSVHKAHQDRIGAYTAHVIDLEREIEKRVAAYSKRRQIVTEALVKMDERNGSLLLHRYIEGESWKDVAEALGISVTWAYTLHNRALKEFENVFYN